jgi:5-formyltetrahydrofolate cyclo-ligase
VAEAGTQSKATLRAELLARRAARPSGEQVDAGLTLVQQVLALPQVATAGTVAAYVAIGGEPDTGPLIEQLVRRGTTVLLPLLRPDFDLDWAPAESGGVLRAGRFGLLEPSTAALGVEAVRDADVVLCPGVAADLAGWRLGRGGGSYDRVLSRLCRDVLTAVLLYDDEVLADVPHTAHDRTVDVIVTPRRVLSTSARRH